MSIEELEILRKKARNADIIERIIIILVPSIMFVLLIFSTFFGKLTPFSFIGVFLIGGSITIPTLIISDRKICDFTLAFKKTFVLKALNSVFTDLIYEPEQGLEKSVIEKTEIMYMGNRYLSNDFISGKYKNVNVMQADVMIEEVSEDRENNTHVDTLFEGRWMIFDFNKFFKANIYIHSNNLKLHWKVSGKFKSKYKKVMMEDEEFNNNFQTYAQDEHEAFYILTPSLMEKIKNLTNNIKGELLYCFIDNKLHVGIQNNEDAFEYRYGLYSKINEEKIINQISQDIKLITNFVDELSLDNDLFRREV